MALIIDPDNLNQNTEITISTTNKTLSLSVTGNLNEDGVTGQALYSFLKEEWKTDASLIPYPFPMVSITPEQFEFIAGWVPADDTTRNLLRSCGWRELDETNVTTREYMGIISLGDIDAADIAHYAFTGDTSKTAFDFAGPVNQGIQTFGDSTNGNFNRRSDGLTTYIRTQGKLYGSATTASIGLTSLNYIANRFPLAEAVDIKITASDNDIQTTQPYLGMSITYASVVRDIGGTDYNFKIIIDGNNGTAEQINEFAQFSLRQSTDIDSGSSGVIGNLADSLTAFLGNTLKRTFPFVASGSLVFNSNLQSDSGAIYRVFFTSGFGTAGAVLVNDNSGNPMSGLIGGAEDIGFDFDYDGNVQNGRSTGTDAEVTVVAIGLNSAQYVSATSTIGRASGQSISLVAPLERNYSNA